ncbi:MAG: hypothetical protein WB788_04925 [Thermoplasmata archaeon]
MASKRRLASSDPPLPQAVVYTAHELGEGRLEPGLPDGRAQKVLRIDMTGAPPNLLGRLLVGSYITGQDQVIVTARHGLTVEQRKEIRQVVDRTLGMTVVADSPATVEIQNFIDPGKHELPRLLHRVVQLLQTELKVCHSALTQGGAEDLPEIESLEEEVDRLYLLVVRQLLLSSDNPRMARNIDVESHHYQIGDRLVAKVLEVTGDLIYEIGTDLQANLAGLRATPRPVKDELLTRIEQLDLILTRTMEAFGHLSVVGANANLNEIKEIFPKGADLGQLIARRVADRKVAVAAQRIASNLVMALEMMIIVNEVTINRSVEPETVALSGTRLQVGASHSPRPTRVSHTSIAILATDPARIGASDT